VNKRFEPSRPQAGELDAKRPERCEGKPQSGAVNPSPPANNEQGPALPGLFLYCRRSGWAAAALASCGACPQLAPLRAGAERADGLSLAQRLGRRCTRELRRMSATRSASRWR